MATVTAPMTIDEFLALPEDDHIERWLVDGELREFPMSRRSPKHGRTMTRVVRVLDSYCESQPKLKLEVYTGDIYFRLRRKPDRSVGTDVAVVSAKQVAATPENAKLIDGPPTLAVEILSASDPVGKIQDKIDLYLNSGTPAVWVVDPYGKKVTIYRPKAKPILITASEEITGDPEIPGLRFAAGKLFR